MYFKQIITYTKKKKKGKEKNWLIDWLFTVLRPAQEFFTYMETSPLPVKGCKILAYARRSGPLSREGSLSPVVTRDLGFFGLIRRTASFSRLLRHTRGCRGSILTRIKRKFLWNGESSRSYEGVSGTLLESIQNPLHKFSFHFSYIIYNTLT
jgi:hypothetical protein